MSSKSTQWFAAIRKTIHELGGTMPENLPVAENIKKVASREKKRLKAE
jgi:DNA-damage-inducible protein D